MNSKETAETPEFVATTAQSVYRICNHYRKDDQPRGYLHTLEISDERSGQVLASCDVTGRPAQSSLTITDAEDRAWAMRPNRKIMPSRWIITDPEEAVAMQLDQKTLKKLANPLYQTALSLLDGAGEELYRLVDARTSIPDRIMAPGLGDWVILQGDRPVATLVGLPPREWPSPGLLGKLRSWLSTADPGIASIGPEHVFPAPVALGMHMIFKELTDTSGVAA